MASDYITLTEFKVAGELVGFDFADYDAQRAISAASRGIDEHCGRFFYTSSATQSFYYSPTDYHHITINDLVTLGTVSIDNNRDGVFETDLTQNTHFVLTPFNGAFEGKPYEGIERMPLANVWWPCWPRSIRVTGQFGWSAVPDPVKEATTILATRLLKRAREAPFGVVGFGADGSAVRISRSDPDVAFLLDPYMKGSGVLAA